MVNFIKFYACRNNFKIIFFEVIELPIQSNFVEFENYFLTSLYYVGSISMTEEL